MRWKKAGVVSLFLVSVFIYCSNPFSDDDDTDPGVITADQYEPDNSQASAKSFIPDGSSQVRTLKKADQDWISFSAVAGKSYTIYTTGNTDTHIRVYNSSSSSSPIAEGDDSPSNNNASVTINSTSVTTYYVCITGNDPTVSGSYDLQIVTSIGLDSYEPDSIPRIARSIGSTIQNRTLSEKDVDWVTFYGTMNDSVLFTAAGTCRLVITLYNIDTATVLQSSPTSDSIVQIKSRLPASGYYFVKITALGASVTGSYKLTYYSSSNGSLTMIDAYENDNTKAAAKLLPGVSTLQDRTLPYGDTDWVKLPVVIGKQYTISFSSYATGIMYNRSGEVLNGPSSSLSLNSSDNDTVYIMVTSSSSNVSYTLTLSTLMQPSMPDEYEVDNTKEMARTKCFAIDTFIQDRTLSYTGTVPDTDWVAFSATGGKQYTIRILGKSSTSTMYCYLYNKTSTSYINYTTSSSMSYTPSTTDTLFLMIRSASSVSVAYTLSIQGQFSNDSFEPDSTRLIAKVINSSPQNHILIPHDTDWVIYTAIINDSIEISTTGQTDTKLALFTSSGSTPILESDNISTTDKNAFISWKAALGGTFYIRICGGIPSSAGPYTLRMASTNFGTIVAPDSFENDNKKAGARLITDTILNNQRHSLTLGDTDWVAFPVLAGGRYTFTATNSNAYLYLYLYSSTDSLLTSYSSSTSVSFTYSPVKSDTVYLRISSTATSVTSEYRLSMSRVPPSPPDAYEDDNTKAKAQIIKDSVLSSQPHSLTLNDTDWIAVPVIAGGNYTITTSNSSGYPMNMYCYTSNDSLIASRQSYTSPSITFTLMKNDTIYIRYTLYSSAISAYYISMTRIMPPAPDAFETDNSKTVARIVTTAISSEIHTLPLNDTDWIGFKVMRGGQYSISISNSTSYPMTMYLYSSKDSLMYSRASYTNPSTSFTSSKDDTVYCKIINIGSSISRYTFTLTFTQPPAPDTYEFDNARTSAQLIGLSALQSRTLGYADTDWVKIGVETGYIYTVSAPATFTHYLYLYYNTSTSYATFNSGTSISCTTTPAANDTLYIMVRNYSTGSSYMGSYTLTVTRSATTTLPTASSNNEGTKKDD